MIDEAYEIFNYLPINKNLNEEEYVDHLWDACSILSIHNSVGSSFATMPFHLLFMLSLQYKVLRIQKEYPSKYKLAFTIPQGRDNEKVSMPNSVFELALLNEKSLISLFTIINVNSSLTKRLKDLVEDRNDRLAHAKGAIIRDLDEKIQDYIKLLIEIQEYIQPMNNKVASRWTNEMKTGKYGVEYMKSHFIEEYLCPEDMHQGKLAELDKKFNAGIW